MVSTTCQVKSCGLSESFEVECGLIQSDPIAPLLFNIALQAITNRAGINQEGTVFTKMAQVLAYADVVVIIGRSLQSIRTAFEVMDVDAKRTDLHINEEKTKIMLLGKKPLDQRQSRLVMGPYNFEVVRSSTYLGSIINENQDEEEEVKSRIVAINRTYFSIVRLIKSRVSSTTKITLYKTLIRPVVTYGGETWTLSNKSIILADRFERVILRRILRPVCENDLGALCDSRLNTTN
ncbi:uncharacterized protein [Halyomorpha halys]|uniref:uncharacterized protein n=1 Tax=Halyomorpha halys TaxID=286706 RepID=UPI0034D30381